MSRSLTKTQALRAFKAAAPDWLRRYKFDAWEDKSAPGPDEERELRERMETFRLADGTLPRGKAEPAELKDIRGRLILSRCVIGYQQTVGGITWRSQSGYGSTWEAALERAMRHHGLRGGGEP